MHLMHPACFNFGIHEFISNASMNNTSHPTYFKFGSHILDINTYCFSIVHPILRIQPFSFTCKKNSCQVWGLLAPETQIKMVRFHQSTKTAASCFATNRRCWTATTVSSTAMRPTREKTKILWGEVVKHQDVNGNGF